MKKFITCLRKNFVFPLFLVMLIMGMTGTTCVAEVVQRSGNTFEVIKTSSQDVQTPYNWKDKDGIIYPIYITKKGARTSKSAAGTSGGSCYIKRISKKTGKEYKYYLPKEIQEQIRKELGNG